MIESVVCSDFTKEFQIRRKQDGIVNNKVQSFISNISFPKSLDELLWYATEHGCYNVENILNDVITTWTSPKWAKIGDIVFFMHAKTAKSTITKLRTQLLNKKDNISTDKFELLYDWINIGLDLYKQYGGKIFAVGRVIGAPEYIADDNENYEDSSFYHWGSKIYSEIELYVLDNPIDISEFNDFIFISRQSGITPVFGKEFVQLKELVMLKNSVPQYFSDSISTPLPLARINAENWIGISEEYRRSFMLESQFRSYYVDYLLSAIGDRKTIYKECRCVKKSNPASFVDNIIYLNGKYLPVEVKLSVEQEKDIKGQVTKYCNTDEIIIDSKSGRKIMSNQVYNKNVLIIDTYNIYIFNCEKYEYDTVFSLNDLRVKDDLKTIKNCILTKLYD